MPSYLCLRKENKIKKRRQGKKLLGCCSFLYVGDAGAERGGRAGLEERACAV